MLVSKMITEYPEGSLVDLLKMYKAVRFTEIRLDYFDAV
jgi:hypothetical protein